MSKLAVIVGATGTQGGSVVTALLKDPIYKIRAITRNTSSDKAKALAAKGVELVSANLDDVASLEKAFTGATVIFGVTDFFAGFIPGDAKAGHDLDYRQGVNIAVAASKVPTLEHYIWSTLPYSEKLSGGAYAVPHFDGKARVDEYIQTHQPALLAKTTFLYVAFYASNLLYPPLTPNYLKSASRYVVTMPLPADTPLFEAGDVGTNTGVFVAAILAKPDQTRNGQYVLTSVHENTFAESLAAWAKASGKADQQQPPLFVQISVQDYEVLYGKVGTEMGVMFQWWSVAKENSWDVVGGGKPLKAADLGLKQEDFVLSDQAWKAMDWSEI